MGRRRACLPIPAGLPHYPQISRGQTLGRSAIPDCPGGSTGTSRPFASLRAKGRSASGRVPPMDYLDNPERRSAARPSDDTSANSYGFAVASTLALVSIAHSRAGRLSDRLMDLAEAVRRLDPPNHRDIERFHINRPEISAAI